MKTALNSVNADSALRWCYFLSVALSPLGPVCHYSLWCLCLPLAAYAFFAKKTPLLPEGLPRAGKAILALLAALALWQIVAGLFSFDTLAGYGRNVTPFFECAFGAWLAALTLRDERGRDSFVKMFVAVSFVIAVGNILRYSGLIADFPNHALEQTNSLGMLGMMLFPVFFCFAYWRPGLPGLARVSLVAASAGVTVVSCSSGAWLSAFLGWLVALLYAARFRKFTARDFALCAAVLFCCAAALNFATGGRALKSIRTELLQARSFGDPCRFTNGRNDIWRVSWRAAMERPILGSGGRQFYDGYRDALKTFAKEELKKIRVREIDHPHSTYLYLLYTGGAPALSLFCAAACLCLLRALRVSAREKDAVFPWAVVSLALLAEILTYGTNGDVFQGRRDISVMMWCFLGVTAVLPSPAKAKAPQDPSSPRGSE